MTQATTSAHTPGPWVVSPPIGPNSQWRVGSPAVNGTLAAISERPEAEANALLFAAAPDLLAVCKDFEASSLTNIAYLGIIRAMALAVIAKAEGRHS